MKRLPFLFLVLILFSFLFTSCIETGNTPEDTAQKFLTAIKNQKWNTAKRYSTEDSEEIIDILSNMITEEYIENLKNWEIEISIKELDEDTALCSYIDQDDIDMEFLIKKIDEKWKVEYRF